MPLRTPNSFVQPPQPQPISMRWTREKRAFLSRFTDTLKATAPQSNGRVEWQHSMYTAWEARWPLDSDVKKSIAQFFRDAIASEQSKKSSNVTKGSRSSITQPRKLSRENITVGKDQDCSRMISSVLSSVSTSRHAHFEGNETESNGDDDGTTTVKTEQVTQSSPIEWSVDEPMGDQVESNSNDNATTMSAFIEPYEPIGDWAQSNDGEDSAAFNVPQKIHQVMQPSSTGRECSVHEPTIYESTSKDTHQFIVVLPGLHANEVDVTLSGGFLFIVAEKATVKTNDGPVVKEQKTVRLEHKSMLPKGIQAEDIHAWMKNGLLTVTCPTKDITPRKIEILASSPRQQH